MANYPEATSLNGYYFKDKTARDNILNETNTRQTQFNNLEDRLDNFVSHGYVPYAVDSTSEMTNTKRIYVLKSTGKWYYYDTDLSAWTIGGDYQSPTSADALSIFAKSSYPESVDLSSWTWVNGGVNASTHNVTSGDTDRIRNKSFYRVKAGSVIKFSDFTTYTWKVTLYKHTPKMAPSFFISEPVAFTDELAEFTIPYDCFAVITIKSKDGSDIAEDFSDITALLSSSTVYLQPQEYPYYENLSGILETVSAHKWSSTGSYTSSANDTTFVELPVKEGEIISIINVATASSCSVGLCCITADGTVVNPNNVTYNTSRGMNGKVVPANCIYALIYVQTGGVYTTDDIIIKKFPKPEKYQDTVRLLGDDSDVKLIAHRGLEYFAPEATIPAYTIAGEKGLWGCKLDICETADGEFVMSHDTTVDRMTDGSGNIIDMTLAQLEELTVDAGNHIADYPNEHLVTLEDALDICKRYKMRPIIEFKNVADATSVANVLAILEYKGLANQTICQCSDGNRLYLHWLRNLDTKIPILLWSNNVPSYDALEHTIGFYNSNQLLSSWSSAYTDATAISNIRNTGMYYGIAVADTSSAINKCNTAISNGAVYIVTDRVTPDDIAPDTYSI